MDDEAINEIKETTAEIRECCKDIKVLGRKDLKALLAWGKAVQQRLYPRQVDGTTASSESGPQEPAESSRDELEDLDSKISSLEVRAHYW